jgi:hypothetical protein
MPGLSQRAYARHRGVTHRAVQKAIKAGRITRNSDGTIDPATADAQWKANTDPAGPTANGTQRVPVSVSQPQVIPVAPRTPGGNGDASSPPAGGYLASRAVREAYRARREKLAFERDSGALVPIEDVRATAFATGRRIREHLLTLPDRIAPLVAGFSDAGECHRVITEEVEHVLEELNDAQGGSRP